MPEVNASSTADIAFLLLIFFLLVSSMDMETGIARVLAPYDASRQVSQNNAVKERNVLQVREADARLRSPFVPTPGFISADELNTYIMMDSIKRYDDLHHRGIIY